MTLRQRVHQLLELAAPGDRLSHLFDLGLLGLILANVTAATLATEPSIYAAAPRLFDGFERVSLWLFCIEYFLRAWACTADPRFAAPLSGRLRWALQPLNLVDLLAILPFVLNVAGIDARALRVLRLLRIFRVARLLRYADAMQALGTVLARRKIELATVLFGLLVLLLFAASLLYVAEHEVPNTPFRSIPAAMWWSIVTLTTVGYGDMVPVTAMGKTLAGCTAILGIGMLALPTSILGAAFMEEMTERRKAREHEHREAGVCPTCKRPM